MGGGLEWSAVTLASHVMLVMSIGFAFANAIWVRLAAHGGPEGYSLERLQDPVIALCIALVTERLYYVAARLLVNTEFNLWSRHPAPEFLSACVALSIFWLAVSILRIWGGRQAFRVRLVMIEAGVMLCVVTALIWGLW